jgi:hypothetical protein
MNRLATTVFLALVIAATVLVAAGCGGGGNSESSSTSGASSKSSSTLGASLKPSDFSVVVDNPYFPLPVGRTWVYRGTKDGKPQIDRVTVMSQTKLVAEGITARVVKDVATHNGKLLEKTFDWHAQDKRGNVWYVGEDTTAYLANGKMDKSGSWEAGVSGAKPGIVMLADPEIPDAYRQEYLKGEAEDTAWVVNRGGSISVPFATVRHILTTLEFARIEPAVVDQKIYAPGIGIVLERALAGPPEVAKLVQMTG